MANTFTSAAHRQSRQMGGSLGTALAKLVGIAANKTSQGLGKKAVARAVAKAATRSVSRSVSSGVGRAKSALGRGAASTKRGLKTAYTSKRAKLARETLKGKSSKAMVPYSAKKAKTSAKLAPWRKRGRSLAKNLGKMAAGTSAMVGTQMLFDLATKGKAPTKKEVQQAAYKASIDATQKALSKAQAKKGKSTSGAEYSSRMANLLKYMTNKVADDQSRKSGNRLVGVGQMFGSGVPRRPPQRRKPKKKKPPKRRKPKKKKGKARGGRARPRGANGMFI